MKKEEENWETEEIEEEVEKEEETKEEENDSKKKSWLAKDGELAVDVYETEDEVIIQAPIAGVKKEDLEIITEKDVVTIKGKRERPIKKKINHFYTEECFFGNFQREVILPEETDPSRIEASMDQGVLTVKAPKIEREKKRKVDV